MKGIWSICLACFFLLAGCDKKNKSTPPAEPDPPVVLPDNSIKCQALPPAPQLGWQDTSAGPDREVNAFIYNPLNANDIVYVANGDLYGYNKLYSLHVPTQQTRYLGTLGNYLPQVNSKGWVVFSNLDNNLFKIKINGDSMTQLTAHKICHDPKWDYTGDYIYYYQEAYANVPSQLVKVKATGGPTQGIPAELPYTASFKLTDKVLYLKTVDKSVSLILRDMVKYNEKELLTAPFRIKERIYFDNLTFDNNDENFYWSNDLGIFKCNLATLSVDTLFKNCPNYSYDNPVISSKANELTFVQHIKRPLDGYRLYHEYKTMEMNLVTRELNEVTLFK